MMSGVTWGKQMGVRRERRYYLVVKAVACGGKIKVTQKDMGQDSSYYVTKRTDYIGGV